MNKQTIRQTITTKYLPLTTHKPPRIKATHSGKALSVTISKDSVPDGIDPQVEAARLLKEKLGWKGEMVGGAIDGGMVFVFIEESFRI